jgi:protein-S-isoprenylcysteine O-methyltransferase Ste14
MWANMLLLWISWFVLCENDPYKLNIPDWMVNSGLVLFIAGLLLFIIPVIQLKGVENIKQLATSGMYKIFRHPMYLGFIFWVHGYPLFMKAQIAFLLSPLLAVNILYWRYLEEQELLEKYSEYAEYKKHTIF